MAIRIVPDENKPSASIEIPLAKPLPDYDLERMDQPTPRDVDVVLVSQGFRDLVDDARGVLMELLAKPITKQSSGEPELELSQKAPPLEIIQLTGAICPGGDEIYRPGLWIVLRDPQAPARAALTEASQEHIAEIMDQFVKRLQLE